MLTDTACRAYAIRGETYVYFSNTRGSSLENTYSFDHDL